MDREQRREYMKAWYQRTKESRREKINAWARTSSKRRTQYMRDNPLCEKTLKIKEQRRKHQIKHYYGLTQEQYLRLGDCCMICASTQDLCVDHNHNTGKVRGLLCGQCNRGLGCFTDDITKLESAIRYVKTNDICDISNRGGSCGS